MPSAESTARPATGVFWLVVALGTTMIVSWGQLFYSMAVLWPQVAADLNLSRTTIFAVISITLLVNGLASPAAGRAIDLYTGRTMMCIGSCIAALAFLILWQANSLWAYGLGWVLGGIAMSLTMYDPAFATLSQHAGSNYRRAMTAVTLFGGFASTVFWPLTAWIQAGFGWRGVFLSFVLMQLFICLPLHAWLIPSRKLADDASKPTPSSAKPVADVVQQRVYRWLVAAFSLHAFVMSVMAVHLLALLQARGLTLAQAVSVGMVIGPMQVAGRVVDIALADKLTPKLVGIAALGTITLGMLLLIAPALDFWLALLVAGLWGAGNGLITIAKGISVAQVFGRNDYGAWMGRMARWTFCMHALAPASFAVLLSLGLQYAAAGWLFGGFAGAALVCYWIAMSSAPPGP